MSRPTDRDLYRLFDRSPIGIYRSREDGELVYVNPALARMLGYATAEELLAINLNRDIYADPTERARLIAEHRAKGVIDGVRAAWRHRDGRIIIVKVYGHVVESADEPASFDASVVDVTEIETQRDDLERTARTLDLVVRQMPAMYWLVDKDLRLLRTGGAIEEILGYEPDRWIGKTLEDVLAHDGGDPLTMERHRRALVGETVSYQSEYMSKQFSVTVAPYRRDGAIVGVIGTSVDVTAMRALERRMVDAQRAESLGVLAGGLAHDFNNLLVALLGNADLGLRDTPVGAPGRVALENVRQAALRAAELTDQLLAYAGRGNVAATRVAPRHVIDELVRIAGPTIPATIDVRVDIAPELAVRGDPAQIRQVMLNLLTNARDAVGTTGTVTITGSVASETGEPTPDDVVPVPEAGRYVAIEVADTGPGVDRETRRRIFEPFFTTKPHGHGLGLAAVLGIVRSHRGGVRLISSPGAGARFIVLWPATATPIAMTAVAPPAARTVLVIDDEDLVRDVVARMIQDLGYAALTASDGLAGLDLVARQPVDAVLVDLTMPRMSGADVVAALRVSRPDLPVVLCTGYDRDRRGPVQADAYLPKPFRLEALEQALAKLFG